MPVYYAVRIYWLLSMMWGGVHKTAVTDMDISIPYRWWISILTSKCAIKTVQMT